MTVTPMAVDKDGLAGAEPGDHGEVEVDGARGFGQDGRLGDAEPVGEWQQLRGRYRDLVGVAAAG